MNSGTFGVIVFIGVFVCLSIDPVLGLGYSIGLGSGTWLSLLSEMEKKK